MTPGPYELELEHTLEELESELELARLVDALELLEAGSFLLLEERG